MTARRSILVAALFNAPAVVALWSGRPLELTSVAVGGVEVGGSARRAERVLREALGAPDRVVRSDGCELDPAAEPRRHLFWGALTVALAPTGNRLVGWTVGAGRLPDGVRLPHDVTTATTVRKALRTIPGATARWDDVFQKYWITTPKEPPMMWAGDRADGSGRITYITNAFEACE
ncbi:hypothetical protein [Actinoplanes flavus]|uniref:Uncharacterized protein n=1 Tax=Actinoplanes flavus TaxID=2820290 RepID=A0ABS3UK08_9ACTN|nr:hypothetical protein [Actinoplanes flavus]MBO3739109.1 hypothetical protein [Actinoplanes flavus]